MLKLIHVVLAATVITSFVSRIILAYFRPKILQRKIIKIVPHILDTVLLVTGVLLVYLNNWFDKDFHWLVAKLMALILYVLFGVMAMRTKGMVRALSFSAAILSFSYIVVVAISKTVWFL